MSNKKVQEGLGELADMAERDHEVQMARADLYKIAKYAIKLHDMLKQVTEAEGLEGWQQSKITKAADYIGSVYHSLDYDMKFGEAEVTEARDTHCSDKCCGSDVKAEDCTCPPTCKHCNCNAVKEGKSPHKKGTKKYKAHMAAMHAESANDPYKQHLRDKLAERQLATVGGKIPTDTKRQPKKRDKVAFTSDQEEKIAKMFPKKKTDERSLTKGEEGKREKYVKGMKKAKGDFKKRYGKDAEAVMYATATKMAKK